MRIGTVLPNLGPLATPRFVVQVAQQAEALDYDTVWVAERLLYPLKPQTSYPGAAEGTPLPEVYRYAFTPIETLTYAAAQTSRIGLGTSVLVMPFHNPVLVARQLATLDVFSGGRLRVGLGQGWSKDEYDATGATLPLQAARADEFIAVLQAMWTTDPVEFAGQYFRVPRSIVQPKPVQRPRPPIYLAAYTPRALQRVGQLADGWLPTGLPLGAIGPLLDQVRQAAETAGRDPARIELIVLAHLVLTDQPLGAGRQEWAGSLDEIRADLEAVRALGASEVIINPGPSPAAQSEAGWLAVLERLRQLG